MGEGVRVLIVDDEGDIAELVTETLSDAGYDAVSAPSAAVALALLQGGLVPEVILLDLRMPGMDGAGFLVELARMQGLDGVRVVAMSAAFELPQIAKQLGVRATLRKPFTERELLDVVRRALH